jgi:dienelactone hydrolase
MSEASSGLDQSAASGSSPLAGEGASAGPDGWVHWLTLPRTSVPRFSSLQPARCIFRVQRLRGSVWYAWDLSGAAPWPVPALRGLGPSVTISPDGTQIWWSDELFGDQAARWRCTPFTGGDSVDAFPGTPPGASEGLAVGLHGTAAAGLALPGQGSLIVIRPPGEAARPLYRTDAPAHVCGMSADESLICLMHAEHGDPRHPALHVLRADGSVAGSLWDGPGLGLETDPTLPCFSPVPGDQRIVARHERRGQVQLLLWCPVANEVHEVPVDLPGDLSGGFTADGSGLLITQCHRGRTSLHVYDLASGAVRAIETRPGVVGEVVAVPGATAWYSWSSPMSPPVVIDETGALALPGQAAGDGAAGRVTVAGAAPLIVEARVDGDQRVPALLTVPDGARYPAPAVFLLHGGPRSHDGEEFSAEALAWRAAGLAVVRVNYRGSSGYGRHWRDAALGRIGITELADVGAVRSQLIADGVIDPNRCVLAGASWGGYLALLGAGRSPQAWCCALAANPIADYAAAYEQETQILQAFDRAMFGGSPLEVPERYRVASPISYVADVRAPVLIVAGNSDTRCPPEQARRYADQLRARGHDVEFHLFASGHGAIAGDEELRRLRLQLEFVRSRISLTEVRA